MTKQIQRKLEEELETPDPSWSKKDDWNKVHIVEMGPTLNEYIQQLEAIQGPEDWERLLSIQCDHEGMNQLLFTPDGDVRHVNGYQQGK